MNLKQQAPLAWGEYILPKPSQNNEIAGARRELLRVVSHRLPRFARQLREQVYPSYAARIEKTRRDGEVLPDSLQRLPALVAWAEGFNAAGETWILEGAVRTLALWRQDPELMESLDIRGFATYCAIDTLSAGEEDLFQFEHPGWDPQFQTWTHYRHSIEQEFDRRLDVYEQQLRLLMTSQGAVLARRRYSRDNFEWFALYQLGGMSAVRILKHRSDLKGDESTILKGVKTAAELLQWKTIRKSRNRLFREF